MIGNLPSRAGSWPGRMPDPWLPPQLETHPARSWRRLPGSPAGPPSRDTTEDFPGFCEVEGNLTPVYLCACARRSAVTSHYALTLGNRVGLAQHSGPANKKGRRHKKGTDHGCDPWLVHHEDSI